MLSDVAAMLTGSLGMFSTIWSTAPCCSSSASHSGGSQAGGGRCTVEGDLEGPGLGETRTPDLLGIAPSAVA